GSEAVEQELDRRRTVVLAGQDGGMIAVEAEAHGVGMVAAGARESLGLAATVGPLDPAVGGPPGETGELRLIAHRVDGGEESGRIHSVHWFHWALLNCLAHDVSSWVGGGPSPRVPPCSSVAGTSPMPATSRRWQDRPDGPTGASARCPELATIGARGPGQMSRC